MNVIFKFSILMFICVSGTSRTMIPHEIFNNVQRETILIHQKILSSLNQGGYIPLLEEYSYVLETNIAPLLKELHRIEGILAQNPAAHHELRPQVIAIENKALDILKTFSKKVE